MGELPDVPAGTGVTGIFELRLLEFNSTRARRQIGRSKHSEFGVTSGIIYFRFQFVSIRGV